MKWKIPVIPACMTLFVLQLAVPGWMIVRREITLRHGEAFKFATAPVDPVDAFRGRYVSIQVQERTASQTQPGVDPQRGRAVYVTVENKPDGFARLGTLSRERPEGEAYIRARAGYGPGAVELPLDRFYMNEERAPEAERAYRASSRTSNPNAYILVRIRNGDAVIEDLFLEGRPVRDYLRETSMR